MIDSLLQKIGLGIITISSVVAGWFGVSPDKVDNLAGVNPIAGSTYALAGSGVSSSATSITLQSFTITQTGQKISDSDMSDTFFLTIEPGNRTKQEIASCTTVVQNANGTATLSGCLRGLSPIPPYTASTTLQFVHSGGSQVIFSDPPNLFKQYAAKSDTELISGQWTASSTNPFAYDNQFNVTSSSTNKQIQTVAWTYNNFVRTNEPTLVIASTTFASTTTFGQIQVPYSVASSSAASVGFVNAGVLAGCANADQSTKGCVEEATVSEINAGTASGGTGARLFMNPNLFQYSNFASSSPVVVSTTSQQTMATTTLDLTAAIQGKNYLEVLFQSATTSSEAANGLGQMVIQFNGDVGNNYSVSGLTGAQYALIESAGRTGPVMAMLRIFNINGDIKVGEATILRYATSTGAFSAIDRNILFTYTGTSPISSISFGMRGTNAVQGFIATSTLIRATGY